VTEERQQVNFPKEFLPAEAKPGDMLAFNIAVDQAATAQLKQDTKALQDKLQKTDSRKGAQSCPTRASIFSIFLTFILMVRKAGLHSLFYHGSLMS
jgi:hypothetical protein